MVFPRSSPPRQPAQVPHLSSDCQTPDRDHPTPPPPADRAAAATDGDARLAAGFYAGPTFDQIGMRYVDFANTYSVKSHGLLHARFRF